MTIELGKITSDKEAFLFIQKHLMTQGTDSRDNEGECSYRGHDDDGHPTMCAVGCLIKDEEYNEQLEGQLVTSPDVIQSVKMSNPLWRMGVECKNMLHFCQRVHDFLHPRNWEEAFNLIDLENDFNHHGYFIRKFQDALWVSKTLEQIRLREGY